MNQHRETRCSRLAVLVLIAAATPAAAQCSVVADLEPGPASSRLGPLAAAFGERLYFSRTSATTGSELWMWDTAGGARIVVDLAPGIDNSSPEGMTPCCTALGPRVFYSGFEIGHGHELYASDGTAAGTGRLKELRAGSNSSLPSGFVAVGRRVFFVADDGTRGQELYVSDGTASGTHLVADIRAGSAHARPVSLAALRDLLLFSADDGAQGRELWISDGTAAGTRLLADIAPGAASSNPTELTRVGDVVYFVADDATHGPEVWRTDGTAAGTAMIGDLFPSGSVGPVGLCACGDRLFFHEWKSGGAGAVHVSGGTLATTVNLGVGGRDITSSGDRVFFAGYDPATGQEPWTSDGTVGGTRLVADLVPGTGGSSPAKLVPCGDGVCFVGTTAVTGEIWFTDGTGAGTSLLCTLDPTGAANPEFLTVCRGHVFLYAITPSHGRELHWIRTPGATTVLLGGGSGPDFPTLATANGAPPVLGTSIDLVGEGPAGHAGVLLAGGAGMPAAIPAIPGLIHAGCDWVGLLAGAAIPVITTAGSNLKVTVAVPADPALEGAIVELQALWWSPAAVPALQASNGVQLALGTARPH